MIANDVVEVRTGQTNQPKPSVKGNVAVHETIGKNSE